MSYFDVEWSARTNPEFQSKLSALANDIDRLENEARQRPAAREEQSVRVRDLLRLTSYNFGFLTGYFFPSYIKGSPLSLSRRPFAYSMYNLQVGGSTTLRGSRQISKSTNLSARQLMLTHALPGFRSIYIAPHPKQVKTYADRLKDMERFFRFYKSERGYRQNLYFKEYPRGAMVKLIHCLGDATGVRGNTTDELLYDEFQNFDINLITEVEEVQKASDTPITIYAGTSTTTDSALEAKYMESSQSTWHLRCGCGEWLNCGDKEQSIAMVQFDGVTCPKCSRVQDVSVGQWVHADQRALHSNQLGFHIPQIIIPEFTTDAVQWGKIFAQKTSSGNFNKFLEEIMGIPTEEGARELTKANLQDICTGDLKTFHDKARNGGYLLVISGCDWGGSDYVPEAKTKQSYTVHAMLGVNHDRSIDIIHFKQYAGMDYESIANQIYHDHAALGGEALGSDFGVGQHYNSLLRERIKNVHKHFIFSYVGPASESLSEPKGAHMFNQWSLNRTESITSLYDAVKQMRLHCYQWGLSESYLMQFLNLVRTPSESATGATSFTYRRHGSKTDDPLHAVNFAYVIARVLLGEPLIADKTLRDQFLTSLRGGGSAARLAIQGRRPTAVSG